MSLSRSFLAASLQRCRFLSCPASAFVEEGYEYVDLPVVATAWNEDLRQHLIVVGDVRRQTDTNEMVQLVPRLTIRHPGSSTDLQVARLGDDIIATTSTSQGGICLMNMQLPAVPGATTADLQFVAAAAATAGNADDDGDAGSDAGGGGGNTEYLYELAQLHQTAVASIDINTTTKSVLSVAGDGSICIVPLDAQAKSKGTFSFKAASDWSGYSHGRWVDTSTFATTGVIGGLQMWDTRRGPLPVTSSPSSWGHTGCAQLDKQCGPARQLLCLCVHPSRPNLAATGASGGGVSLWDLRFQSAPLGLTGHAAAAGDVWELKFDPCEPLLSSSVSAAPPLLYCTSDGALCQAAANSSTTGGWGATGNSTLTSNVLIQQSCSINSFDVERSVGLDIIAASDYECLLFLHRNLEA